VTLYETMLEAERKKFDLWPWMEVSKATLPTALAATPPPPAVPPAGAVPPGTLAPFSIQQPYALLWDKMPFVGFALNPSCDGTVPAVADLSIGSGTYNWAIGQNVSRLQQTQSQVAVEDLLGSYNDRWVALARGGRLPKDEVWQGQFYLGTGYNGGLGLRIGENAQLYTGLRGYRRYEKNSLRPLQMSRKEMLKSGKYLPTSYTYSGLVTVNFTTAGQAVQSQQLVFGPPQQLDCDFMCHRIRIRPQAPPIQLGSSGFSPLIYQYIPTVQVNIVPLEKVTPYLGGNSNNLSITLAPWQMVMGVDYSLVVATNGVIANIFPRLETQWNLPHPVMIGNNERYNLQAQAIALAQPEFGVNDNYSMVMEFLFDGELLVEKKKFH